MGEEPSRKGGGGHDTHSRCWRTEQTRLMVCTVLLGQKRLLLSLLLGSNSSPHGRVRLFRSRSARSALPVPGPSVAR